MPSFPLQISVISSFIEWFLTHGLWHYINDDDKDDDDNTYEVNDYDRDNDDYNGRYDDNDDDKDNIKITITIITNSTFDVKLQQ